MDTKETSAPTTRAPAAAGDGARALTASTLTEDGAIPPPANQTVDYIVNALQLGLLSATSRDLKPLVRVAAPLVPAAIGFLDDSRAGRQSERGRTWAPLIAGGVAVALGYALPAFLKQVK